MTEKLRMRILIVDDNPDDRQLELREINALFPGAEVIEIADDAAFEAALALRAPDLVLTDLDLRWGNGREILTTVKARYPTCPVVMFTGTGDETIAVELMKAGLDDYVVKSPRQLTRLRTSLKIAVEHAGTRAALSESEQRFRLFTDESTNVLWIRDAATLRMEFASPAFEKIYGILGPDHGDNSLRSWARLILPESRGTVLANFRRVRAGERVEHEFRIKRASDGAARWVHNTDFPMRDAAGHVRWLAGVGADITDAKEVADRQGVMVAELQHRTRNLITVLGSLSDRTLSNAKSLEDFGKRFGLRLSALSRVQGLLSHQTAGERVTFDELLRTELAAHGATDGMAKKVTLDGPAGVPLRSGTVQTFALALHELATNAVKYGALAAPGGHLTVRWHVEPASGDVPPYLHVEWRESGVAMPELGAPARGGGYGRELIERALPYQLNATTSYEMGSDGVRCTISVPVSLTTSQGISRDE